MQTIQNDRIRQGVRDHYAKIARGDHRSCACEPLSCCSDQTVRAAGTGDAGLTGCGCGQIAGLPETGSDLMGYSEKDIAAVPEGANLGLGCGNPLAMASLQPGETVVDLGSGGGFDCFLAARQVGERGRVIGVDMTPDMISKARSNAEKTAMKNVEFRLGEIEHLPVADNTADIVISNCVINLSPDKAQVFREAFRILKPGGRLSIADIVAVTELPDEVKRNLALISACVGGAATIDDMTSMLAQVGFDDIRVSPKDASRAVIEEWVPGIDAGNYVVSAIIEAVKPK